MAAAIAPDGDLMLEVCWRYGDLLVARGRLDEARDLAARGEALCAASDERRELGCVQRTRARLLAAEGSLAARAAFEMAAETLAATGRVFEWALSLRAQAEHEAARGDRERAERLLDQARGGLAACAPTSAWLERIDRDRDRLRLEGTVGAADAAPVRYGIVTRDPELLAALEDLPALATSPWPVLVEGESGTGKELVARALHATSGRSGAFVAVNCAAIPRDLFESELFGHLRGAFSGAHADKPGLFEQATGGMLFLDEIGEMPLELQAKLLRVLDDGLVRRLGDVRQRRVDVKVVAATNRPLEPAVVDGRFRGDLFHRLAVHSLRIKPLRERPSDIGPLARYLLEREGLAERLVLGPEQLADFEARPWLGNARELRNVLLRLALQRQPVAVGGPAAASAASLRATRSSHERRVIEAALAAAGGNVVQAARALRLHATTLRRKMRALGVDRRPS
jgi:transcriptional regulator with PAS, ATPase and Fis domain